MVVRVNLLYIFLSTISQVTAKAQCNGRKLLDVTCYVRLHTLLHVVECCWELLRKV